MKLTRSGPLLIFMLAAGGYWLWRRSRLPESPAFIPARAGEIALVTGASAGIGAAYARALARLGYNLVLSARRADRLQALADQLRREHGVQVEVAAVDLADIQAVRALTARAAQEPSLTVLVNNAGFGMSGDFDEQDAGDVERMNLLHVQASALLARAVLPGMRARRRGAVVNVASVAAFAPIPGLAAYGATKSYLVFLSEALAAELAGSGVRVQALCPGMTRTDFHTSMASQSIEVDWIPEFLWLEAGQVVSDSLAGLERNQVVVVPGAPYRAITDALRLRPFRSLLRSASGLLPRWLLP